MPPRLDGRGGDRSARARSEPWARSDSPMFGSFSRPMRHAEARLHAHEGRFDHEIVGAADHDEVFDIVASHEDQLALPVEIEGVHDAEPRLSRPAVSRHVQPAAEQQAVKENQDSQSLTIGGDDERARSPSGLFSLKSAPKNCMRFSASRHKTRQVLDYSTHRFRAAAKKVNEWLTVSARSLYSRELACRRANRCRSR